MIFKGLNSLKASYIYIRSYRNIDLKEVISLYKKAINDDNFNESDLNKLKDYAKDYNSSLMYDNPSIL